MALITKWEIPPEFYHYLQRQAPYGSGVAYTKYIVNKVGLLSPKGTLREYTLPPVPDAYSSGGDFNPIDVLSMGESIWLSSMNSGAIGRFHPRPKPEVTYYQTQKNAQTQKSVVAFFSHHIASDNGGNIWVACFVWDPPSYGGNIQIGVARLRHAKLPPQVDFWVLPDDFVAPFDLWIDGMGGLWFTVNNVNVGATGMSIGRLDPKSGELIGWRVGPPVRPAFTGITGLPSGERVWVTQPTSGNSRIHCLDPKANTDETYSHASVQQPNDIALLDSKEPWFTSGDGHVNAIVGKSTGKESVTVKKWGVEVRTLPAELRPAAATASAQWKAPILSSNQPTLMAGPFKRWAVPTTGATLPRSLTLTKKGLHFADLAANEIGFMAW